VHENTEKKIKILSKKETLSGLMAHIDISNIPKYYGKSISNTTLFLFRFGIDGLDISGGELDFPGNKGLDNCRFFSPEVLALQKYVDELNSLHALKRSGRNDSREIPPGSPGEGGRPRTARPSATVFSPTGSNVSSLTPASKIHSITPR
jgi:hypothetical protein